MERFIKHELMDKCRKKEGRERRKREERRKYKGLQALRAWVSGKKEVLTITPKTLA